MEASGGSKASKRRDKKPHETATEPLPAMQFQTEYSVLRMDLESCELEVEEEQPMDWRAVCRWRTMWMWMGMRKRRRYSLN